MGKVFSAITGIINGIKDGIKNGVDGKTVGDIVKGAFKALFSIIWQYIKKPVFIVLSIIAIIVIVYYILSEYFIQLAGPLGVFSGSPLIGGFIKKAGQAYEVITGNGGVVEQLEKQGIFMQDLGSELRYYTRSKRCWYRRHYVKLLQMVRKNSI